MKETTAARLKQYMSERRLRQVDIIRMCEPYCQKYNLKLTKSDLSQFVSGKVIPGQWKVSILSHALGVSEPWLMGFDVPQQRDPDPEEETPPATQAPKTEQGIYAGLFVDALTPEEQQRAVDLLKVAFPKNEHDKIV